MALSYSGTHTISEESRKVIEDILRSKLDDDGRGEISSNELETFMYSIGFYPTREDIEFLKKHFDKNGDGKLEVKELMDNIDVLGVHSLHGQELMDAFKKIDRNGDGYIRFPELLVILTAPGTNQLSPLEASKLLDHLARTYDTDHDGKFSYAEFVKMFMADEFCLNDDEEEPKADTVDAKGTKKKKNIDKKESLG